MAAADHAANRVATKQYTYVNGQLKICGVALFDGTGDLLALIEGDYLGSVGRRGVGSGDEVYGTHERKDGRNYRDGLASAGATGSDWSGAKAGKRGGVWPRCRAAREICARDDGAAEIPVRAAASSAMPCEARTLSVRRRRRASRWFLARIWLAVRM